MNLLNPPPQHILLKHLLKELKTELKYIKK